MTDTEKPATTSAAPDAAPEAKPAIAEADVTKYKVRSRQQIQITSFFIVE